MMRLSSEFVAFLEREEAQVRRQALKKGGLRLQFFSSYSSCFAQPTTYLEHKFAHHQTETFQQFLRFSESRFSFGCPVLKLPSCRFHVD